MRSLQLIRTAAKRIPVLVRMVRALRRLDDRFPRTRSGTFARIYRKRLWGGKYSRSGGGSDPAQTQVLVRELPQVLRELGIRHLLDIPCGDFAWMRSVDLKGIHYVGADLLKEIIAHNRERIGETPSRKFVRLDLLSSPLPKSDLILCRDCLVHLSFKEIARALSNIRRSGAIYLAATTFPEHPNNRDVPTGGWRPLDLCSPPFLFPPPLAVIREQCTELGGKFRDKSLAFWRVEALQNFDAS